MDQTTTILTVLYAAEIYCWIGAATAAAFLLVGIDRVDPGARGSYAFRPLLVPGVVVLWPLVLMRWIALERAGRQAQ